MFIKYFSADFLVVHTFFRGITHLSRKKGANANSSWLFSHCFRKTKNQQPQSLCKLLIFSVDQPGLEPGTSRL